MYSPIPAISKTADTIISANSTITSMTASNNVAATKTTMPKTRDVQRQHHEKEKQTQRSERQPLQQQIEERDDNNQNDIQNDYNNNSYRRRRSLSMIRQPNQPRERSSSRINHNKYVSRCQSESPMRGRSALSTKIYVNNTDCRDGEVNNKSTNTKYHHSKQQTRSCDRTNNQTTMNGGNASINSKYSSSNISLGTKNTTHSLNFLERILSKRRRGTRDIQSDNSILESREESNSSHVIGNTRKYSYGNNEAETRYYRTTMSTVAARSTDTVTTKEIGNNIETMLRPNGKNTTTNNAVHPIEMKARVLQNLIASKCTDVQYNDKDLYGDGDQSPVYEPDQQYLLHTLFYTGVDFDLLLQEDWEALCSSQPNGHLTLLIGGLSEFASHCIAGHYNRVKEMLEAKSVKKWGNTLACLTKLLEKRETSLRLTPLMMVVAAGTRIPNGYNDARTNKINQVDNDSEGIKRKLPDLFSCRKKNNQVINNTMDDKKGNSDTIHVTAATPMTQLERNQLEVIKVLLEYGARPDAKDVGGKTVVHYGAGVDATKMTMEAVSMCIKASKSSFMFGREIEIRNDSSHTSRIKSKNSEDPCSNIVLDRFHGKRGIAQGYIVDTGCRIVYFFGHKAEIRILKPYQMKVVHKIRGPIPTRLCDACDRTGRVPLLEVYDTTRVDVAEFLLLRHHASINVSTGWDRSSGSGCASAAMSATNNKDQRIGQTAIHTQTTGTTLLNEAIMLRNVSNTAVSEFIYSLAIQQLKRKSKNPPVYCSQCGQVGSARQPLRVCKQCMSVRFCSNECQLMHWQAGHMYECKQLASERNVFVLITPDAVMVNNFGGRSSKVAFRKPNDVNYGDPFTVKITFIKKEETLWIVDKTKQCEFSIYVGGSDISSELYGLIDKIQSQSNFVNEECGKLYVSAVFEDEAICKLYINQTKIKTW